MGSVLANHICLTGLQIHRSKINGIHDIEFIFTKISNREQLLSVLLPRYSHVYNEFYPKEKVEKVILMPADTLPRIRDSLGQLYSKRYVRLCLSSFLPWIATDGSRYQSLRDCYLGWKALWTISLKLTA